MKQQLYSPCSRMSLQINHHVGTPKHKNYKRYDNKLGYINLLHGSKDGGGVVIDRLQIQNLFMVFKRVVPR